METSLLTLRISRKRQIVHAAQRARQIGRILGLDADHQAGLACGVFETCCQARTECGPLRVEFYLRGPALDVAFHAEGAASGQPDFARLRLMLPETLAVTRDDAAWLIRELDRSSPVNCFEEMRRQAQELLQALAGLRRAERESQTARTSPRLPAAA